MSATAEYPRADHAANNVDPMVMANALDHIARTAQKSRSQTRRLRWIQLRAEYALTGREYRDIDVELPKSAGDTNERLQKRMAYHIAVKHNLMDALRDVKEALRRAGAIGELAVVEAALLNAEDYRP